MAKRILDKPKDGVARWNNNYIAIYIKQHPVTLRWFAYLSGAELQEWGFDDSVLSRLCFATRCALTYEDARAEILSDAVHMIDNICNGLEGEI